MHIYARAEDNIWKKLFPGVTSRGLKWVNKTYKLKRSIIQDSDACKILKQN